MAKPAKSRLHLCLQVCPLDAFEGLELCSLICDIEKDIRRDVEFTVSHRRDTNPETVKEMVAVLQTKFTNVSVIHGKRFTTGWPGGCNDLWSETMMRVGSRYKEGKITASGTLTFEADCVPMRPDWIDRLCDEWARCEAAGKHCIGHVHTHWDKGVPTHINGNAIFASDMLARHPVMNDADPGWGWDAWHGKLLMEVGLDTDFIFQLYRIKSIERIQLETIRKNKEIVALFHGIKNGLGIKIVREMIRDGSFLWEEPKQ